MLTVRYLIITILIILPTTAMGEEINPILGCRENPAVTGECFMVTGELTYANGVARIAEVNKKRSFIVLPVGNEIIPRQIKRVVSPDHIINGEYLLCPVKSSTKENGVCVETVEYPIIETVDRKEKR